jgi:DNA-binding response OmpR family regulator
MRRMGANQFSIAQSAPMPVQWRVDRVRLTLAGPNARACKLSKSEAWLWAALMLAKGQEITRTDLLTLFDVKGVSSSGRRGEAMIGRLRGKVMEEMNLELPIKSIYGRGYAFVDHALVI